MSRKYPDFALVTIRTHPETGWLQLIDWRREPGDVEVPLRAPGQESQYCQVDLRALSADVPALLNTAAQAYRVQRLNQGWFYPLFNWFKDIARQFGLKL